MRLVPKAFPGGLLPGSRLAALLSIQTVRPAFSEPFLFQSTLSLVWLESSAQFALYNA